MRYNEQSGKFEGYIGGSWTNISDATTTGDMSTSTYDPGGISEQLVGLTAVQTLTSKTLTSPTINSPNLGASAINAITEIAAAIRSGDGADLITGTAGTNGDLAQWNIDGDLVDGPTPPSGTIVGTSDAQTLTSKTFTSPTINTPNLGTDSINAITEISSSIRSGDGADLITGTAGTNGDLAVWNIDGDLVDGPTPPSGTIVGTTDSQTLTSKTLTSPTINTPNFGAGSFDSVSEFASAIRTGLDLDLVTGTKGTNGNLAEWDVNGDLVNGPTPPSGAIVGTSDTQTLTNKTLSSPQINMGSDASGDVYYRNGSTFSRLARGTNTQVLTINNNLPSWQDASSGYGDFIQFGADASKTVNTTGGISITQSFNEIIPNSTPADELQTIAGGSNGTLLLLTANSSENPIYFDSGDNISLHGNHTGTVDELQKLGRDSYAMMLYDDDKSAWAKIADSGYPQADITWVDGANTATGDIGANLVFSSVSFGAANTDRIMIVAYTSAEVGASSSQNEPDIYVGGVLATPVGYTFDYLSNPGTLGGGLWYAAVPTGTSGNITIVPNSTIGDYTSISVWRAVGLKSSAPLYSNSIIEHAPGSLSKCTYNVAPIKGKKGGTTIMVWAHMMQGSQLDDFIYGGPTPPGQSLTTNARYYANSHTRHRAHYYDYYFATDTMDISNTGSSYIGLNRWGNYCYDGTNENWTLNYTATWW
jgi:hypothetical protein